MSLLEEIKADKEQLEEAKKVEETEEEIAEETSGEEGGEEAPKEEKPAEAAEKPTEPEKEEVKEEKQDDAAFARLRRDAAANKRRAEALEEENTKLKAAPKEEVSTEEVAAFVQPPEIAEIIQDHRVRGAEREFQSYEQSARTKIADFDEVTRAYTEALFGSIKVQNPRMSNMEIAEKTKRIMLEKAGTFLNQGYENPVEEMYLEAKELGFRAKPKVAEEKEEPKPDMKKVAENRKRSAGMTGVSGREEGLISKKTAAEMSPAEWKALDRAERQRLMSA